MSIISARKFEWRKGSTQAHSQKGTTCSGLMKIALNNVLLPTLLKFVNNIVQHIVTPDYRLVQAQQLVQYC